MTSRNTPSGKFSRRAMLRAGAAAAAGLGAPWITSARAAPVNIRYATGGGIGPNEMETIIWLDYLKQNVLKNYNKAYTLDMTFTRGSPEAAQLLAAGQVQIAALSSPAFATTIAKDAVPDGLSIISDIYQDGHTGYASNTFFVLKDSPIAKVADLKGKKVAINAFGSAVDLVLRVALKKAGLDPRRDVQIVEVTFANIAPAIREKRVDCGVLVIPFLPGETRQFGFILNAPSEIQQNATPYVTIASIGFTEIPAPLPRLEASSTSQAPDSGDEQVRRTAPIAPLSPSSRTSSTCCGQLRDK